MNEDSSDEGSESDDSSDEDVNCAGKPYLTISALTCLLHALLYETECDRVAANAKDVTHEMGRGHSNLPDSKFNALTQFRSKTVNLHQIHYELATNCGLLQSNKTFTCREE